MRRANSSKAPKRKPKKDAIGVTTLLKGYKKGKLKMGSLRTLYEAKKNVLK